MEVYAECGHCDCLKEL